MNIYLVGKNGLAEPKLLLQLLKNRLYVRHAIIGAVCFCVVTLGISAPRSKLSVRVIPVVFLGTRVVDVQFVLQELDKFLTDCL